MARSILKFHRKADDFVDLLFNITLFLFIYLFIYLFVYLFNIEKEIKLLLQWAEQHKKQAGKAAFGKLYCFKF